MTSGIYGAGQEARLGRPPDHSVIHDLFGTELEFVSPGQTKVSQSGI